MGKATEKELLEDKRIRSAVNNSIHYGLNQICQYAIKAEKPVKGIAGSFVRNVFPFYKKSNPSSLVIQERPVSELEVFWREVSLIGCYEFGELERYVLTTEGGIPLLFLTQLIQTVEKSEKYGLSSNFLEPIYQKVKERKFDYRSLEEITLS